jgi:hypothetical protein
VLIVLVEESGSQMIFANVTHIEEKSKPSIFNDGTRKVVNLYSGEQVLMGGDDIDLMSTKLTVLPNPEKE